MKSLDVNDLQFESKEVVTPAEKKATILHLYEAGLLTDENGKVTAEHKQRILDAFGFGSYENVHDLSALHANKAGEENVMMREEEILPDVYDDHAVHIREHTRFLLSAEFKRYKNNAEMKEKFIAHMDAHKKMQTEQESAVK